MEGVSVLTDQQFQAMGDDERKSYKAGARGEDLQDWMDAPAYRQGRFDAANGNVSSRWNAQATSASATMSSPVDPAARDGAPTKPDSPISSDATAARAFDQLVQMEMKQQGVSREAAVKSVAAKYPSAHQTFLKEAAARDADRAQAFGELVNATMKERGCERTKAFEIAATKYPEAHRAFLRSSNPGVTVADASKPETARGDAQEAKAFEQLVGEIKRRNGCTALKAVELAAVKRPELHKAYLRHMNPGVALA